MRERVEDIPQIVDYFLQSMAKAKKTKARKVSPEALAIICRHNWPGNVRELENLVYRSAVIAQSDTILPKDLPDEIRRGTESDATPADAESLLDQLYAQLTPTHADDMITFVTEALVARGASVPAAEKKIKKPAAKKS